MWEDPSILATRDKNVKIDMLQNEIDVYFKRVTKQQAEERKQAAAANAHSGIIKPTGDSTGEEQKTKAAAGKPVPKQNKPLQGLKK